VRRWTRLALISLLLACVAPAQSAANGDPASDVLHVANVFLPGERPPAPVAAQLRRTAARAQDAGYQVRAAIIAEPADLGLEGRFWERPQEYADFLARELVQLYGPSARTGVLIVMPAGYGLAGKPVSAAERRTLGRLVVPSPATPERLTRAAATALERLAAADGKPLEGGGGASTPVIAGVLGGLLALSAVAVAAARTRRGAGGP
jgi:hypothetical protein